MTNTSLTALFQPSSIAVIGASNQPGKIGHSVMANLIAGKYEGKIYPINNKTDQVSGLKAYPSILDVPGTVDTAVITIPAHIVIPIIEECGKKGVKLLVVITSGFSETGNHELEKQMVETARNYNMRILGPNIVGYLSNADHLNASFAPCLPYPGKSSLVSQSGALLIAIDTVTYAKGVGFDKLISVGNMCDLNFADMINLLEQDPDTASISLYIEGFKDGRRFMESARNSEKPIIALKSGVSSLGAAAAASHTGSLAGAAKVYSAAFRQCGVIQASDLDNLFDRSLALSLEPPLKGENILIITNGGGVGVLATDAAEKYGIPLKFAPQEVQEELKKYMPEFGSARNPVDLTGMAGNDWYETTTQFALSHPWVDGLIVLYCETAVTQPQEIAESIHRAVSAAGKREKPVTVSFVGGEKSSQATRWLIEHGIAAYFAPDVAVNAMAALRELAVMKETLKEEKSTAMVVDKSAAEKIITAARADGRNSLTEIEAKQVFELYGLPVTKTLLAKTEEQAVSLAKQIGFPVVMKIVSPDILHKSDAGGVKVNIKDEQAAREAFQAIMKNAKTYKADANIHGIAVQEMAPWGTETILGSINDPTFGPTMMFGLGGIFVEVLKDVTFRVSPVSLSQAKEMLGEIRGAPILKGVRGELPRDKEQLAQTIVKYSQMILDLKDEISESDANPVLVYEEGKGIKVVDARIILKKK